MSNSRRSLSRRQFLSWTAGAVAAPYVLTSPALGQRRSRSGEKLPASERIGLALIGIGRRGASWASMLARRPEVQCVGVCDVDSRKFAYALRYIRRYQKDGCPTYRDYRRLLDVGSVDAVVICTPDHWHGVMACDAARASKDVFCESPLSLTVREADAMATVARRYGRVFQTGTHWRSSAGYRAACELIAGKKLGQIRTVHVQAGLASGYCSFGPQPVPKELDWDLWLGPAPKAPYSNYRCSGSSGSYGWRAWRDYGGGPLASNGSHYFDAIQWALGRDDTGPVQFIPPDGKEHKALTIRYADGVTVVNAKGPKGTLVEFTGTDGVLGFSVGRGGVQTWPEDLAGRVPRDRDSSYYRSNDHMANFLEAVKTRRRCVSDVEIAARSVTVCHLACIASWLGRPLTWDPAKRQIVGDPQAARWLDRPKRAPWRV